MTALATMKLPLRKDFGYLLDTTFNPRARYRAAQLAPITPVPTIATFRISLLFAT
jgi:hypothetical protein